MRTKHLVLTLLIAAAAIVTVVLGQSTGIYKTDPNCPCCCPELSVYPELHSTVDQLLGSNSPDNFSASFFTGQRQRTLPSQSLVTTLVEISVEGGSPFAYPLQYVNGDSRTPSGIEEEQTRQTQQQQSSSSNSGNSQQQRTTASPSARRRCSWADKTAARCSLTQCIEHWQAAEVEWRFAPQEGHINDLLSTGLRTISPTVQGEVDASRDSFRSRMSQSTKIVIGAFYRVPSQATCRSGVHGLPCYADKYWYVPRSGFAWVSDIATPIGEAPGSVVAQSLPLCSKLLSAVQKLASSSSSSSASSSSPNGNVTKDRTDFDLSLFIGLPPFDPTVALSRRDRVLCSYPVENSADLLAYGISADGGPGSIIAVVPIVRSRADVVFTAHVDVQVCINNHFHPQPDQCGVFFIQGDRKCGSYPLRVEKHYSLLLSACSFVGLSCAIVSSLALLFGASAIMIAIDVQLLAVIAQGSCSASVARPATQFLQQFLFLGRALEEEDTTTEFYSSIVAWLVGCVSVAVFVHGMLVVIVSVIWRSILKRAKSRKEKQQQQLQQHLHQTGGAGVVTPPSTSSSAGVAGVGSGTASHKPSFAERLLLAMNVTGANNNSGAPVTTASSSTSAPSSPTAAAATSPASPTASDAGKAATTSLTTADAFTSTFMLEERRILARTAAALHFPSASLLVLLVSLQGLWFAAVNVWWYSMTPVDSLPGIVGCLFALLMTLIILVLARQTRLIFTPYSWLHPEQALIDAREQALEISEAVHQRSRFIVKKSWFFPYGAWGPARPRRRMGTLFLPVKARSWIGVPFLVSLMTCLTVSIYPVTVLGCSAQQMFLSLFFFGVALVVWKSQPMRAPYANSMFVAVRGALSILTFCRTIVLVTDDEVFDAAYFLLIFLVQALILAVGVVDIWCGIAEHFIWLPHLEYRQNVIRARTGGALRQQRQQEEEAALEGVALDDDDDDEDANTDRRGGKQEDKQQHRTTVDDEAFGPATHTFDYGDSQQPQQQVDFDEAYEMADI